VPQQFFDFIPIPTGFFNTTTGMEWKFSKTGQFFEAGAEYDFPLFDGLKLGFWIKGSWMGFKGNGTWHFNDRELFALLGFTFFDITTIFGQDTNSSLYRYEFAGGLTAFCDF
jgi:hypothetical protein